MKREILIHVRDGKIVSDSTIRLKDIIATLPNGNYSVFVEEELDKSDADYYRKRFFTGVDLVTAATGNAKDVIVNEVKVTIVSTMTKATEVAHWIDLDKVIDTEPFSLTWLTPTGWKELYQRFRLWAYNLCDCYV